MIKPNIKQNITFFLLLQLFLVPIKTSAQVDSLKKIHFGLSGYAETFFLYDFSNPSEYIRPNFFVSHHRHHEFNLNIGMIRFSAENKKMKTALAFMTGTYVNANLAHEPRFLKNIYEANVALKMSAKNDLWLQMGVFNSHIGFESAIGADCYTLTRSVAADNSPYYETGARLNYKSKNARWDWSFLLLNGWQRMQRLKNNNMPSFGTQITYTTNTLVFNSSNYFGNEGTDQLPIWRYFHNFYMIKKIGTKSVFIAGLDIGMQRNSFKSKNMYWLSPQVVYRYSLSTKFHIGARLEHYVDKDAAITIQQKNAQLNVLGASLNVDYNIIKNILFRVEFKQLNNNDPIFIAKTTLSRYNSSIAGAFTVKF
jgi:hypothetical protein